jgi:hypothetical protein
MMTEFLNVLVVACPMLATFGIAYTWAKTKTQ